MLAKSLKASNTMPSYEFTVSGISSIDMIGFVDKLNMEWFKSKEDPLDGWFETAFGTIVFKHSEALPGGQRQLEARVRQFIRKVQNSFVNQ